VLGIYVSDHPLRGYERSLAEESDTTAAQVGEREDGARVRLAGVVSSVREIVTKRTGERMAAAVLEDFTGQAPLVFFAKTWAKFNGIVQRDTVLRIVGTVSHRERAGEKTVEVSAFEVSVLPPPVHLDEAEDSSPGVVIVTLLEATRSEMRQLADALAAHKGSHAVEIRFQGQRGRAVHPLQRVKPCEEFVRDVKHAVPGATVEIVQHRWPIAAPARETVTA
jgi:DNA polymerase-3 subunit alpha